MSRALRPVLVYALLGSLWILFSDLLLGALVRSPETLTVLQMAKGWIFVAVTALLLFRLIQREIREMEKSRRELEKLNSTLIIIAEVNRLAAEAQDPEELARKVSALLAEKGGYAVEVSLAGTELKEDAAPAKNKQVFPLSRGGRKLGALIVHPGRRPGDEDDGFLFQEVAAILTRTLDALQEQRGRKEAENLLQLQARRLEEMSWRDHLTGLYSRQYFTRLLEEARPPFSLVAFDLERFGEINSLYGHATGDRALAAIGMRLYELSRRHGGQAVRLGGDAFVLFLPGREPEEAERVGKEVQKVISQPIRVGEREVTLTPRGAVVSSPLHGRRRSEIEFALDLALRESLEEKAQEFRVFDPSRLAACPLPGGEVRKALAENLVFPVFQPIKELRTGHVHGYELLARLKKDETLLPASSWIKKAEEEGCLPEVEKAIINALSSCHRSRILAGKMLFINLDPRSLRDAGFRRYLLEAIQSGLAPRLVIEFTERHPLPEENGVLPFLEELRRRGVWLALDDFGAGYSSLSYLKKLKVDYIKIDGSLTRELGESYLARQLAQSVHRLATEFGMLTIAEGIEDAATGTLLASLGIPLGQGYHLGRPQTLEELERKAPNPGAKPLPALPLKERERRKTGSKR